MSVLFSPPAGPLPAQPHHPALLARRLLHLAPVRVRLAIVPAYRTELLRAHLDALALLQRDYAVLHC